jgi:hypothetical protein
MAATIWLALAEQGASACGPHPQFLDRGLSMRKRLVMRCPRLNQYEEPD